uniref:NAD(P)/FAD-dependent oxidoreductase n=1 Tax=Flavobacterium sp. TaxID=239 RepID=UPI00404AC126
MTDYIIVGSGIAGVCFAELAIQNNKSLMVFDNNSQPSSKIAGGMYNPVILKRFSAVWKANEQLLLAESFYSLLEQKLKVKFDYSIPVYRKFTSVEEQNNWFHAADQPILSNFLSNTLLTNTFSSIEAPFGFGKVTPTGYLDTKMLTSEYTKYLFSLNLLSNETFDYDSLFFNEDFVSYKGINAKHIIFAEGFGLHANPFFNDLPLDGTKGELLLIKSPNLKLDVIINSGVFIIPIGADLYKVGATYDWSDKTNTATAKGKNELLEKLNDLINCDYEIIDHFAGVRPTVKDRRPLVGTHFQHKNMHILNGLGTRGVMFGPYLSKALFDTIENNIPLDAEIDIQRFYKKRVN